MKKLLLLSLLIVGCASKPKPNYEHTQKNFDSYITKKYKQ